MVLPTPTGRKYSTRSSLLTSSPTMTLTHPPFYIAPPLTFPLLPNLLPFLAPGRCFRTLVLTIYKFFYLFLSLRSFAHTSVPLLSTFRKLAGMTLPPTLLSTVLGGLLRWKKRLVKNAKLSLPLTEVMKVARLTSPLLDAPRQSSSKPRLRHDRRLALLFHSNQTKKLYTLFSALSLALLPRLPSLLISLTVLPGNWLRSMPLT